MQPPRSLWIVLGEVASILAFVALFLRLALVELVPALSEPAAFAAGVAAGALLADVASGTVHWLCDRFGSESTPLVGRYLIASFREHHRDPASIARHGLLERSGSNALAAAAFLAGASTAIGGLTGASFAAFAAGGALAASLLTALTNEIHLQAHRARPSGWVSALQRLHLVLSPAEHARHHGGAHDRAYCIANGWGNPLLDGLRVFARIERRLGRGA